MTPKQKAVVDFICDGVKAKGYSCEVTAPRSASEGASIRTASTSAFDKIGVTPDGYPIIVGMSPTSDKPYNALIKRLISKAKKL